MIEGLRAYGKPMICTFEAAGEAEYREWAFVGDAEPTYLVPLPGSHGWTWEEPMGLQLARNNLSTQWIAAKDGKCQKFSSREKRRSSQMALE